MEVVSAVDSPPSAPSFTVDVEGSRALLHLHGAWRATTAIPSFTQILDALLQTRSQDWRIVTDDEFDWDSQCMVRLFQLTRYGAEHSINLDISALPDGIRKLLEVATAVKPLAETDTAKLSLLQQLRAVFTRVYRDLLDFLGFVGAIVLALLNLLRGKANTRLRDVFYFIEQCGPRAIGIVALISVLVGMILAYLGSVQLRQFGAEVYVANLVAVGTVREMGALMTAVIMAGRTGAAYAAQLGAMQANEEIDAITTLGISPIEYLVLPRLLALIAVMPLLCIFADVLGLIGGGLVATGMDVTSTMFINQARSAVDFGDVATGVFKSIVFAGLIAAAGCQAGLQSGRSSAAVGNATTRAVVHAIVYLVVADAALNILYDKLHI